MLRGFDRLRLAGTFRALYHPPVMEKYIQKTGFLLKDFKQLMLLILKSFQEIYSPLRLLRVMP